MMINTESILKDIDMEVKYMYKYISELEDLSYQDLDILSTDYRISELNELLSGCIESIHIKIIFFLESLKLPNLMGKYIEEIEKSEFTSLRMYNSVDVVDSPVWIAMTKYVSLINYISKEAGSLEASDSLNSSIKDMTKLVKDFKHKEGKMRGLLAEKFVKEFFETKKYKVENQNGTNLDHKKIDLIASNINQKIYIQVKAGVINDMEIERVAENVKEISSQEKQQIIMCIVANKFHHNSEFKRLELEEKFGVKIIYINIYQVEDLIPQSRRVLQKVTVK